MAYYSKGDLSQYIKNKKENNQKISEDQIWKFTIQICLGLLYLHSKEMAHTDLKPGKLFLDKNLNIIIGYLGYAKE